MWVWCLSLGFLAWFAKVDVVPALCFAVATVCMLTEWER